MRAVGAFIAIIGILIFVSRAPGIIVPGAYRRLVLYMFDNYSEELKWFGRVLFLFVTIFIVVTWIKYPQLNWLAVTVAVCLQVALLTGSLFLQRPAAAREIAESFLPEDAGITRLMFFLATALGFFIAAYGLSLMSVV